MSFEDEHFMRLALTLAEQAYAKGEVPVGAVVVQEGRVLGEGFNQPIGSCDPTAHAELVAMRQAALKCDNYRLPGATLYVTIEPCTMCLGAAMHARIETIVFGASEPKAGVLQSNHCLAEAAYWNHRLSWKGGVLAEEATALMQRFFQWRRAAAKAARAAATGADES